MSDWIQAVIALLLLGGVIGGFLAEIIRRKRSNGGSGNTGVVEAVLEDGQHSRTELWARLDRMEAQSMRDTLLCTKRIADLERMSESLGRRLEECLSRVEGERRADRE